MELPFSLFDPQAEVTIVERRLPHWSQAGVVCFVSFRTADSMPKEVLRHWRMERFGWLRQHGVNPQGENWRSQLAALPPSVQQEFHSTFANRWHEKLDAAHGACVLRDPSLAKIVGDSLLHFDKERYLLSDFVVMPNHVHLLAAFADNQSMLAQCESWKRFSSTRINRHLQRTGRFWQADVFDHLVRSEDQLHYLRRYIADNPRRARLAEGEFLHYSSK